MKDTPEKTRNTDFEEGREFQRQLTAFENFENSLDGFKNLASHSPDLARRTLISQRLNFARLIALACKYDQTDIIRRIRETQQQITSILSMPKLTIPPGNPNRAHSEEKTLRPTGAQTEAQTGPQTTPPEGIITEDERKISAA
jgi:hypothetical protein